MSGLMSVTVYLAYGHLTADLLYAVGSLRFRRRKLLVTYLGHGQLQGRDRRINRCNFVLQYARKHIRYAARNTICLNLAVCCRHSQRHCKMVLVLVILFFCFITLSSLTKIDLSVFNLYVESKHSLGLTKIAMIDECGKKK